MRFVINLVSSLFFCAFLISCTITPKQVESSSASYDGSEKNSGFIGWTTNNTICYGILTPHARDRYNSLITTYKKRFTPPLTKDYGLTYNNPNYYITLEALSKFAEMNRWHKNNE